MFMIYCILSNNLHTDNSAQNLNAGKKMKTYTVV